MERQNRGSLNICQSSSWNMNFDVCELHTLVFTWSRKDSGPAGSETREIMTVERLGY